MGIFDDDEEEEVYLEKEPVIDWSSQNRGDEHDTNHKADDEDNTDSDG